MPSPTTAASFSVNGSTYGYVKSASVHINQTPIDVTSVGGTYRELVAGFTEGQVDLELFYDSGSHSALVVGAALTAAKVTWATGKSISGNAQVKDVKITVAPNDVAMANVTLQFSGSAITAVM